MSLERAIAQGSSARIALPIMPSTFSKRIMRPNRSATVFDSRLLMHQIESLVVRFHGQGASVSLERAITQGSSARIASPMMPSMFSKRIVRPNRSATVFDSRLLMHQIKSLVVRFHGQGAYRASNSQVCNRGNPQVANIKMLDLPSELSVQR